MATQFAKAAFAVGILFFISCGDIPRDNPDDPKSSKYRSSSSAVVRSSSSSSPVTYTLACAAVPSTGIASTTITPPTVTCNGTVVSSGFNWTGAPNWNDPEIGTYSSIGVVANLGNCSGKVASCSGTLTVSAAPSVDELTCTGMPMTGVAGTAIAQPMVRCGTNMVSSGITWTNAPTWFDPTASTYDVEATASCGGSSKTASCGKLTISSVLACGFVPPSGTAGTAITAPTVTCNGATVSNNYLDWEGTPNWSNPMAGSYSGISVVANYGNCKGETAECSGTLTVGSVLACATVPSTGTVGMAMTAPTVTCNGTTVSSGLTWTGAPNWSNPEAGTYGSISVATSSGNCKGETAYCSGTLTVGSVLTCSAVPSTGIAGATITPPTVTCNGTTVPSGVLNWTGAPTWSNPVVGTYGNISVSASSGDCNGKTATCSGTLTVSAVSSDELTCTGMPMTGVTGTAVTQPTVRCGINTVIGGISWTNAPAWANPTAATYNVWATANCGDKQQTASCGTLTVASVLTCSSVPTTGTAGTAITAPAVTCDGTTLSSGLSWTGAPNWTTPTAGTYSSVSVSASSGNCSGKTATCSGTLTVASTYIVTYNAGTGVTGVTLPANQTKIQDVALTLSAAVPTRTGYTFAGWNTSSSGNGTSYASGASYTANANVTLYAQWTATYTITYNANSGTGAPANQTKTYDVALTLSTAVPTRTGYVFASWNTSSSGNGTSYASGASYTANANVTLYAQWTATYTITYNANDGTGAPASQTKTHNVALTLSTSVPTRTGYDFIGWNTSSIGSGTSYAPGASYTANANVTLYAQWSKPVVSNCDGQTFRTVVIGTQTWMAENLNCNVSGSKCYSNSEYYCDKYGRLYDWATAMNLPSSCNSNTCASQVGTKHRGICPSGWHIPSSVEWETLIDYVGGFSTAGRYLKATDGWYNNGNGNDQYGFSALPGGYGSSGGSFISVGSYGNWWSASEYNSDYAYSRDMRYNNEDVLYYDSDKRYLFSVRCVQD